MKKESNVYIITVSKNNNVGGIVAAYESYENAEKRFEEIKNELKKLHKSSKIVEFDREKHYMLIDFDTDESLELDIIETKLN